MSEKKFRKGPLLPAEGEVHLGADLQYGKLSWKDSGAGSQNNTDIVITMCVANTPSNRTALAAMQRGVCIVGQIDVEQLAEDNEGKSGDGAKNAAQMALNQAGLGEGGDGGDEDPDRGEAGDGFESGSAPRKPPAKKAAAKKKAAA